jgi:tetratricopeptide (TPR) repeat protein
MTHAAEGNAAFSLTNFEEALRYYTEALAVLKYVEAPRDPIILLNRSAAYIGLKRYRMFLIHLADAIL